MKTTIATKFFPNPLKSNMKDLKDDFIKTINREDIGFFHYPSLILDQVDGIAELAHKWSLKRKNLIHIGIGGSSLGPEMLVKALAPHKKNIQFINNIDPDDTFYKLKDLDLQDTLFFFVSKSGTTLETISTLSIVIQLLKSKGIPESHFKDYLIFCTDPEVGDLRALAHQFQITALDLPSNIGGRYSVLTPVGLFTAAFAGIAIKDLILGAISEGKSILQSDGLFEEGTFIKSQLDQGKTQTVLMPYSSLLKYFSFWFVQLWAESLGKNSIGLTPIPAYGATDQHSQMQLFMDGPRDKLTLFISLDQFQNNYLLSSKISSPLLDKIDAFNLSEIFKAEFQGTLEAYQENNLPYIHYNLDQLTPAQLGQLILRLESLTVTVALLLKIDPFNQPGVELGKKNAWKILKGNS